jgi:hypothetical protein
MVVQEVIDHLPNNNKPARVALRSRCCSCRSKEGELLTSQEGRAVGREGDQSRKMKREQSRVESCATGESEGVSLLSVRCVKDCESTVAG